MTYFWTGHQASIVVFLGVLLAIALSNLVTWRSLGQYPPSVVMPRVSILVPLRNEARNTRPCIRSLLLQDYANFELLALDDESQDSTASELASLRAEEPRLQVLHGDPLPDGWLGKHWACHQLAEAASGDLLLFVDADTRHAPTALRDAVAALEAEGADLLAVMPRQEVVSWAEQLLVPIINWSFLSFLPVGLAQRVRWPSLSITVGQFMLFRRVAYEQVGGHAAVRQNAVDDLALGRCVKAAGLEWRFVDGQQQVTCRMYHSLAEVMDGLGKNLYAVFGYNAPLFLFVWLWLAVVFCEPLIWLLLSASRAAIESSNVTLASASVLQSILLWGIVHQRCRFPRYLTLLYPLTMLAALGIAVRSLVLTLRGSATWKGRLLVGQKGRWWRAHD